MPLTCQLCKREFPIHVIINGKKRNLCNRKYCLGCSPFDKHNTRDLAKPPLPRTVEGKRIRIRTAKEKADGVIRVQRRRLKLKELAVKYKGGSCIKCGYNKCIGALEFHHTDPATKVFGIGSKGYTRSWEKVKQELNKCILVCANCHREIHYKNSLG